MPDSLTPVVAISECLLGSRVRYDAGHKRSALPHTELRGLFQFRGICPEVGIGLGVPRDPIQLMGAYEGPRAVSVKDASVDVTADLRRFAQQQRALLDAIDGYIFMQKSPSCGLSGVEVFDAQHVVSGADRGVYAAEILRLKPQLPVQEACRLQHREARQAFIARVFVHAHWRRLQNAEFTPEALIAFHDFYKERGEISGNELVRCLERHLARLSRNQKSTRGAMPVDIETIASDYFSDLMAGLAISAP